MSKSILVIETPESCAECLAMKVEKDCPKPHYFCGLFDESYNVENYLNSAIKKPNWCPAVDIPFKRLCDDHVSPYGVFSTGWNMCIDDILSRSSMSARIKEYIEIQMKSRNRELTEGDFEE